MNDPRISLASGKRPALLIKTKAKDETGALYESRKLLNQFIEMLPEDAKTQKEPAKS